MTGAVGRAGLGRPLPPLATDASRASAIARKEGPAGRFRDVLQQRVQEALRWSRHAEQRLRGSGVELAEGDVARIEQAVEVLAERGVRESLVVYGDLALVVSVRNRTVITASTPDRLEDGVFTHIDGAIVVQRPASNPDGGGPDAGARPAREAPGPRSDGRGPSVARRVEQP